jgi:hypothetical protein
MSSLLRLDEQHLRGLPVHGDRASALTCRAEQLRQEANHLMGKSLDLLAEAERLTALIMTDNLPPAEWRSDW